MVAVFAQIQSITSVRKTLCQHGNITEKSVTSNYVVPIPGKRSPGLMVQQGKMCHGRHALRGARYTSPIDMDKIAQELPKRWVRIMAETHDPVKIFTEQEHRDKNVIQKVGKQ
jgi:hypothetical protein